MTENAGMPSTPKKKSPPAILLDGFTWGLWKIIELPFLLLWLVLRGLGEMFKGIWKAIGELDGAAWFWKPSNSFFIFLGKFFTLIFYIPVALLRGSAKVLDKSAGLRRLCLILLLAAGGIWAYQWGPQPTWGKWNPYHDALARRCPETDGWDWLRAKTAFTATHPDLPPGSKILLENPVNGKKLAVRITEQEDELYLSDAAAWVLEPPVDGITKLKVYTREKLLSDPEPRNVDPTQVPGEWAEELKQTMFRKDDQPKAEPPPLDASEVSVPAPAVQVKAPAVRTKTPSAPKVAAKPARTAKPSAAPADDDRLDLTDPILVPDRKRR